MLMLNYPIIFATNFMLIFLLYSPESLNLLGETSKLLLASICMTIEVFKLFLKSIESSKLCPRQIIDLDKNF